MSAARLAPLLLLVATSACRESATPPSPAPTASEPTATSTATATASPAACAPWPGVTKVTARSMAGRADFVRELRYEFATGTVSVHDSDPFATGKEEKTPRVIDRSRALTPDEKKRTEAGLFAICPNDAAMQARCAPGGCSHLDVVGASTTAIEDVDTVAAVMKLLEPFFPELRR